MDLFEAAGVALPAHARGGADRGDAADDEAFDLVGIGEVRGPPDRRPLSFALSDGNSFYCACERVFDASLARVPVIVLSNNDGCCIARTAEAKALGIRMGEPYHHIRDLCRREGVRVFSSNYALYGSMSARVNAIYRDHAPDVEVYSIDESFLDLTRVRPQDRVPLARDMRSTVRAWTGLPTCVGIGPTKVLAKLANHLAKAHPELGGVCDLTDEDVRAAWMRRTPLEEIWGVGRASAAKLREMGCRTVADVAALDARRARGPLTVVGARLVHELRGISCLPLEAVAPTRKGCAVTRSFAHRVTELAVAEEAIATHASRLGEKLRRHGLATDHVTVFLHTAPHAPDRQRSASTTVHLPEATSDTRRLVRAARLGMQRIWADGYRYSKVGVVTVDLVPPGRSARALLDGQNDEARARDARLMGALDACNARFGRGTVRVAAAGLPSATRRAPAAWATKFEMRSPRYTTRVEELMSVRA